MKYQRRAYPWQTGGMMMLCVLLSASIAFGLPHRMKQKDDSSQVLGSNAAKIQAITANGVPGAYDGYTLICLDGAEGMLTSLIDMEGNRVKAWPYIPFPAKFMPNGHIMGGLGYFAGNHDEIINLIEADWDGNILWQFSQWDDAGTGTMMARQHHDFEREGNPVGYYAPGQDFVEHGKTLILARDTVNMPEISKYPIDDDVIYEVDGDGKLTGFVWRASEHFDEMGFNWRSKHGIYHRHGIQGYLHINTMSRLGKNHWYDEGDERFHPDNIIIDSRHSNFIAIIDHETGQIVWRVGPYYTPNTLEGRKLGQIVGQHNAHMIPDGLPGAGNILVFDNGGAAGYGFFGMPNHFRFYSRVIEFNPVTLDLVWEYKHRKGGYIAPGPMDDSERFFSYFISGMQRLPNGNTIINEGSTARVFEVDPDGDVVWEYTDQVEKFIDRYKGEDGSIEITPGEMVTRPIYPLNLGHNSMYRAYRIPPEWVPGNPAGYETWE
jgi:hypothetical protein